MVSFSVTYERYLPHNDDEDICEADEIGFVCEKVRLREAFEEVGKYAPEPSASWVDGVRWFTHSTFNDCTREQIEEGITESRSFHFPDGTTPSSIRRLAKLLGARF